MDWLLNLAGCKDEMVLRLTPGHGKVARTLGTRDHFPGAVVTYAVIHQLEQIAKARPETLKLITSATVTKLLTEGSKVWVDGSLGPLKRRGEVRRSRFHSRRIIGNS